MYTKEKLERKQAELREKNAPDTHIKLYNSWQGRMARQNQIRKATKRESLINTALKNFGEKLLEKGETKENAMKLNEEIQRLAKSYFPSEKN